MGSNIYSHIVKSILHSLRTVGILLQSFPELSAGNIHTTQELYERTCTE